MSKVLSFPQTDDAARAQALDIRSSCIVEAPAGSGKTGLLVQRYLKLLADEHVQSPEEVLAVTFTRKATAELRERVLEQLQAAHDAMSRNETLSADAKPFERTSRELAVAALRYSERLNWQLLEQPMRLNINTFDAVSMQIANALPILSGSGGPREPIEKPRSLYRLAARRTLLQLGGEDRTLHEALRTVLLHRDGNLADCESLIAEMLGSREQWGELVPLDRTLSHEMLDSEVRPRLERALEAIVTAGLQKAADAMPPGVLEELCAHAERLSREPGYGGEPSPIAICAGRHRPPMAHPDHLEHWHALLCILFTKDCEWRSSFNSNHVRFEVSKADKAILKQFILNIQSERLHAALKAVRNLPPARYPDEQWAVAKALFFVLRHALIELKILFAGQGECDFTELALAAREALGRSETGESSASDLALASGGHLRHLLIDEMQDTSAAQYDLIELLTRSWDGATQTLFLVGDPKQSIYLFRAASVERFLRTMDEAKLGEIVLKPLRLTANFRSQSKLVSDFNETFSRLFLQPGQNPTEAVEVPFVEATASRANTQEFGMVWHTAVLEEEALPPDMDHTEAEAAKIRAVIERRLREPLPPGRTKPWQIAVLGQGRKHLNPVVKELQRAGLPYKAIDVAPLAERPEVLDALALTRALLHPADRIAWLAVLHAPWCGLGLADLLTLTGDGEDANSTVAMLVANHRTQLSDTGQRLLDRAWPVLQTAVATLGRTSLAMHVERTWRSLGGDVALTPEQHVNVQRFLASLREVEAEGARVDLDALKARIADLYAEPFAGECQIELLTIHKSKGLEWDLVLLPGLERGSGSNDAPLLNWLEFDTDAAEVDAAVILAPISSKGTAVGALGRWLSNLRRQRELAERKRLFYVACTRGREELHLFAARKRNKDGSLRTPLPSSLLKACLPAAEEPYVSWNQAMEEVFDHGQHEITVDMAAAAAAPLSSKGFPMIERLPMEFDPAERSMMAYARRLEYPPAAAMQRAPSFDRPEGSFAVRAFGNVVHRYLQVLAERLEAASVAALLSELPTWQPRLEASLRGEGLAPALASREASRALKGLTLSLQDEVGAWILSPHAAAANESDITLPGATGAFRVDRTYLAGPVPLQEGENCIWIVDFKTTEQGSRSDEEFWTAEVGKYRNQMETYARLRRLLSGGDMRIQLALYYPLVPKVLHWESP